VAQVGEWCSGLDRRPGGRRGRFNAGAERLALPRARQISLAEAQTEVTAGMLSYLKESRKISNKRLLGGLSVELRFADLKVGLKNCDSDQEPG